MKKIRLDTPRARGRAAIAVAVVAIALLGIAFFRMQVLRTGTDVTVQRGNRLRALPLPAARGDIVDRNGVLLAGTAPATALVLMPAPTDSMRARLERIADLLELPDEWHRRAERAVLAAGRPYVVTTALRPGDVGMLAANQADLPGVLLEPWPQRIYPGGHAATPVVGHVAFEPWPAGSGEDVGGVDAGHVVGRGGLELAFDSLLAGESGVRYVETDSAGRLITDPLRPSYRDPRPGRSLRTKLDAPLQRYVASIMPTRLRSAAVVLDVASGDVLALYAHPAQAAEDGAPENAAVARVDQPGAIFHTITAALALESGTIDVQRPATVPCRGGMRYGERYFRCWQPDGHGQLNLAGGIREGCDVYFHQLALRLGLQALLEAGARLGLDRPTGIELREERAGRYPGSVTALAERLGRAPNPSDALDLGAGHGLNESTLLRMTHVYAALGGGGASPPPRLTGDSAAPVAWRLELPAERSSALLAMLDSVTAPGGAGAAAGAAMSPGTRIRGQLARARDEPRLRRPTGWFVGLAGMAGASDRIAVGVLVEAAPSDATAASLGGRIADYYLRYAAGGGTPPARDTTTLPTTTVSRL